MMRAVVVAGAVGQHEFMRDEARRVVAAMFHQRRQLRHAADIDDFLAMHRGLFVRHPPRTYIAHHLDSAVFEANLVAEYLAFEGIMIRAAPLGLVNRGSDRIVAEHTLECLVKSFDRRIQIFRGIVNQPLHRHRLASIAFVVSRIDNVVMAAPYAGENRRMTRPCNAGEVDRRAVREHRAAGGEMWEVGNRVRIIFQLMDQFRMREAVEKNYVHALRANAVRIENLIQRTTVLALQINSVVGGAANSVGTNARDFRKSHRTRDRRCDIDMPRRNVVAPRLYARPEENQWRARLDHIERTMLPGLEAIGISLRTHHQIGAARAIEELRDSFVGERMTQRVRFEKSEVGIFRRMIARGGGAKFIFDSRDGERILIGDRVVADLLDHLKLKIAGFIRITLEANHSARRPHLVRAIAPSRDEVGVISRWRLAEQRRYSSITGLVLIGIQPLTRDTLRPVFFPHNLTGCP